MKGDWVSVFVAAVAATLLLSAPAVYADQVTVFTLTTGPNSVSAIPETYGTVTIDTTTGIVDAIDLSFVGRPGSVFPVFTGWGQAGTTPNQVTGLYEIWENLIGDYYFAVGIILPIDTLVGYAGGNICSTTNPCSEGYLSEAGDIADTPYTDGQLEPVPEPSSLLLLTTGALCLTALFRRKLLQ